MPKKIYGDLNASINAKSLGSNTIRDINGFTADTNGDLAQFYYTKDYIDKTISVLPISRVGSMDYLPLNINGSFVGSSGYIGKGIYPTILENDGTMVYLRAGTNGSTYGYYYCYKQNARTSTTIDPVVTNEVFVPTIFDSNHTLIKFIGSDASQVLMMLANNGTDNTYVLSLTNGTLNTVSHQSVEFLASLIPDTDPQYATIHGNNVYIFGIDSYDNTSAFAISVYSISVADIKNGVSTSLAKVTGFSGADLFGTGVTASTNIQLTSQIFNPDASTKPLYTIPTGNTYRTFSPFWGNTDGSLHAISDGSNNIRVAFFHACEATTQQQTVRNTIAFSLVLNTSTNEYIFDSSSFAPVTITTDSSGVITYSNPFSVQMQNISGLSVNASLNRVPTFFISNDGVQFTATSRHDSSPFHYIMRSNITNFTSLYEAWNMAPRALSNTIISTVNPVFGSAVGENMIHPQILSSTKVLMHCSGQDGNTFFDYDNSVTTELGSTRTYSYQSVTSGSTITGYAPNVNRHLLDNSDYKFTGMITVVDSSGNTTVYGSSFLEGFTSKPAGGILNTSTMTFTGSYTLQSTALLTTLKTQMLNSVTMTYNVLDSRIAVYYVPDGSFTKSYAIVQGRNDAPTGTINSFIIISEIDVALTGSTVTGFTLDSSRLISRNILSVSVGSSLMGRNGGMIIANYSDFTYVGIPGLFSVSTASVSSFCSVLCKVDNSTKLITTATRIETGYNSSTNGTYEVGVLPNIGFGLFENGDITDVKTKLIFKNFGTTAAEFDAMQANPASEPIERIVVASQEVAQGFIVYFTQDIPALIAGKYGILPATNINLSTIDSSPQNKTFYIYVSLIEGVLQYQLSTTELSEEIYRIFIGTIVTGASGITSISTEKVTRFLTYRPSTTKRGSAIPTSTGVPSGSGTRWN